MEANVKAKKLTKPSQIKKRELLRRFSVKSWAKKSRIHLRTLQDKDREKIRDILEDVRNFTQEEIAVAISLVDEVLHGDATYRFLVAADEDDNALGYVCYGQNPMTSGTWDVYWIAVSRESQRRHIASLLLGDVEKESRVEGGRLIVIETSTKPSYYSARRFYQRMGYQVLARIPRFYSETDDKLIHGKYLTS